MTDSVEKLQERLGAWLGQNAPAFYAHLTPGFTEEQLTKAEQLCHCQIPPGLRRFLAWQGLDPDWSEQFVWPFGGHWPSFESFFANQAGMQQMAEMNVQRGDPAMKHWASSHWLVVASKYWQHNTSALVVDSEGTIGGQAGQVIYYNGWDGYRHVIARCFEDYLEALVTSLEAGHWVVHDDTEDEDYDPEDDEPESPEQWEIKPKSWDEVEAHFAEALKDAPNITVDLRPAPAPAPAPAVEPTAKKIALEEMKGVAEQARGAASQGDYAKVLDLSAPHLEKPAEKSLHPSWCTLMASRALALYRLDKEDEALALMPSAHDAASKELLECYWRPVLAEPFTVAADFQDILANSELTADILQRAQQSGAINWSYRYPSVLGIFTFNPGQTSWKVTLRIERLPQALPLVVWLSVVPSRVGILLAKAENARNFEGGVGELEAYLEACQECEKFGLHEHASRIYKTARELGHELPGMEHLVDVPLTARSEGLIV